MEKKVDIRKKNLGLQSLKFLCAVVVFLSHSLMIYDSPTIMCLWASPLHLFFDGRISVAVFFVLSGYFYYTRSQWTPQGYIQKVKRKLIRLWPLYIVTTLIAFLLYKCNIPYDESQMSDWGKTLWPRDMEDSALWGQQCFYYKETCRCFNPVMWYMNVEFKMVFLMPLLVGLCRWKDSYFIHVLLVLFLLSWFMDWLPFFVAGCITHWVVDNRPQWSMCLKKKGVSLFLLLLGIASLNVENYGLSFFGYQVFQILGIILMLWVLANKDFRLLQNRILVWGGDISYEIYLIHLPLMLALRYFSLPIPVYVIVGFVLTVCGASLLNKMSRLWVR